MNDVIDMQEERRRRDKAAMEREHTRVTPMPLRDGDAVLAEMSYLSYAFNRMTLTAAQMLKLFPRSGDEMERRYIMENPNVTG